MLSQELYDKYKSLGNDHLAKVQFIKENNINEFELFMARTAIKPEGFIEGSNPCDARWDYKVDVVKNIPYFN